MLCEGDASFEVSSKRPMSDRMVARRVSGEVIYKKTSDLAARRVFPSYTCSSVKLFRTDISKTMWI